MLSPKLIKFFAVFQQENPISQMYEHLIDEWSSEAEIRMALASETNSLEHFDLRINRNKLKKFSMLELELIVCGLCCYFLAEKKVSRKEWISFAILSILEEDQRINRKHFVSVFDNYRDLLLEIFSNIEKRYSNPKDLHFSIMLEKKYYSSSERRLTPIEFLMTCFPFIPKPSKPRKMVRKRGYADHGALGSSRSSVIRTHAGDVDLVKAEKDKQARRKLDRRLRKLLGIV